MNGYQVDASAQFLTAAIAAAVGGALCLSYDVLRLARYIHRPSSFLAAVQDVLWWLLCAGTTFLLLLVRCSGVVRFYALLGEAVGFVCCRFTLSVVFMKISKPAADGAKKVWVGIKGRILSPFWGWCAAMLKKSEKTFKKFIFSVKNLLKHMGAVVYNHLKSWARMPFGKGNSDDERARTP